MSVLLSSWCLIFWSYWGLWWHITFFPFPYLFDSQKMHFLSLSILIFKFLSFNFFVFVFVFVRFFSVNETEKKHANNNKKKTPVESKEWCLRLFYQIYSIIMNLLRKYFPRFLMYSLNRTKALPGLIFNGVSLYSL